MSLHEFFGKIEEVTLKMGEKTPVFRILLQKRFHLKSFVCIAVLIVSIISFNAAYLLSFYIYQQSFIKNTDEISGSISRQVVNFMIQLMERGWTREELNGFLKSIRGSGKRFLHQTEIYRGRIVEELYGKTQQPEIDRDVMDTFQTGNTISLKSRNTLINIYPIKAEDRCLSCHINAKVGDVLGVLKIRHNTEPTIGEGRRMSLLLALIFSPIPFIIAGLIATFLNARIKRSTKLFHEKVSNINNVKDLTKLESERIDSSFKEFNMILSEVDELVRKMKGIAVDKDVLEFEIKMLEKFVITSEVVRDWKEYVGSLLLEVNKVMEIYNLFSLFQIGEELYNLDIFWRNNPLETTKVKFEKIVTQRVMENHMRFRLTDDNQRVVHNIVDVSGDLPDLNDKDIEIQTKTLILETPPIGGIVGVSVQSLITEDPIRSIVINGILATLLNVVGSMKAISKYTKDLEYYATRDPLTNLYNQRVLWELLEYEVGRAGRYGYKFSLLVIDMDNFKNINDSYGHAFGDKFLRECALKLKAALRIGDILSRYGGDEFVVVLPEAGEDQAFQVASRIKEHLGELFLIAPCGTKVKATVSIGISVFPDHADNANDLFVFADKMMYKAKSERKDRNRNL
jgi:diguanylate cyclase (GGDEF)-like protein